MLPSELSEMFEALKSQAECRARAQALQSVEDAKIMSSLCYLTESMSSADRDFDGKD